jgi:hypothetical protein
VIFRFCKQWEKIPFLEDDFRTGWHLADTSAAGSGPFQFQERQLPFCGLLEPQMLPKIP